MLSVFIIYSADRVPQLEKTITALNHMDGFDECQKTLVIDGESPRPACAEGWKSINVSRVNNKFCWANMWAAGVATAQHEKIWYLDSDRLLPPNYLSLLNDHIADDTFVFTSRHFLTLRDLDWDLCHEFLVNVDFHDNRFIGALKYEAKTTSPIHGPGKNVMSGNTAFTKKTFLRLGGVDPWYCGHGAFADTDFHLTAARGGCQFSDLSVPELHCHHAKLGDAVDELQTKSLQIMGLDNFIYYCRKWSLPLALPEGLAQRIGIPYPARYVRNRLSEISL